MPLPVPPDPTTGVPDGCWPPLALRVMANRRRPTPAYWEWLYLNVGLGVACAVVLFVIGKVLPGALFLIIAGVMFLVVRNYRGRVERGQDRPDA